MVVLKDGTSSIPAPILAGTTQRSGDRTGTQDLHSNCPICGHSYEPGEEVLALACLTFATRAVPSPSAAAACDPSRKMILGHQACVLPRILTLLAGFQPEARFVRASNDFSAIESLCRESHQNEP